MPLSDPHQQRVAIWGAGREGLAAYHWLRSRHPDAPLALWDENPEALEQAVLEQDAALERTLLRKEQPLPEADWVIKSPGISLYQPRIEHAIATGTHFTSGSNLWRRLRPDVPVIAVTGTKGKSTSAALLAHLLNALGQKTILAGNIGQPLLETRDAQAAWWVVELSSYQLADLDWSAETALLLNLQQEHLDWHGSLQRYQQDKLRIFAADQLRIHPLDFKPLPLTGGQWLAYGHKDQVHLQDGSFFLGHERLYPADILPLPGPHNRHNACAILTLLHALGVDLHSVASALETFRGLPHRLETVCERDGIRWINDSIATTPEASLAALAAMDKRPVVMMVGGHDRGLDWSTFLRATKMERQLHLLALPDSGHRLAELMAAVQHPVPVERVDDLETAVSRARILLSEGGIGLLSPGAPSYGQYSNYEQRGQAFAQLACGKVTRDGC